MFLRGRERTRVYLFKEMKYIQGYGLIVVALIVMTSTVQTSLSDIFALVALGFGFIILNI